MTPKIYVCVGMIASGKSTYCKNAAKEGYIIVNDDSIVNMCHADDYTLYDKSLKLLYKSIENYAISMALAMGRSVLVDRGLNISIQGRQRWIALAKSFDVDCEAIVFPRDPFIIHAVRRFTTDNRGHSSEYWASVAEAHDKRYVIPSLIEGFNKIHNITFSEIKSGKVI